jgi:hypothetical protein
MTHTVGPNDAIATDDDFVIVSSGEAPEEENKLFIEEIGDQFTGQYLGMRLLDNDSGGYRQARFKIDGVIWFMNANYSLRDGLQKVKAGERVRITYTANVDTGQATPMRLFQVEVARRVQPTSSPVTRPSVIKKAPGTTKAKPDSPAPF